MAALPNVPGSSQVIEPFRHRLSDRVEAEAYVASVCFKHGPPRLTGVELEWIVHHEDDPRRPLDAARLSAALGPYAPRTVNKTSPHLSLPAGSPLTLEPGGQVEISALPQPTLTELFGVVSADLTFLSELLASAGFVLGDTATDQHRAPRRLLDTPRYAAMEQVFETVGPHGLTMMCATAGLQVCVDAGESDTLPARWTAVTALGPVLVAAFANSPTLEGRATGWASARMRAVLGTDPPRSSPSAIVADPVADWARRVLDTPVLCVRGDSENPGDRWAIPAGMTFADWVGGARPDSRRRPTTSTTTCPRCSRRCARTDTWRSATSTRSSGGDWVTPVALLAALLSTPRTVDAVLDACLPVGDRWLPAARDGLADRALATAAAAVLDLGARALPGMGLGHDADRGDPRRPGPPSAEEHAMTDRPTPGPRHCATQVADAADPGPGPQRRAHRRGGRRRPGAPALQADVAAGVGPRPHRQPGGALAGARRRWRANRSAATSTTCTTRSSTRAPTGPRCRCSARPRRAPTSPRCGDKVLDILDAQPAGGPPAGPRRVRVRHDRAARAAARRDHAGHPPAARGRAGAARAAAPAGPVGYPRRRCWSRRARSPWARRPTRGRWTTSARRTRCTSTRSSSTPRRSPTPPTRRSSPPAATTTSAGGAPTGWAYRVKADLTAPRFWVRDGDRLAARQVRRGGADPAGRAGGARLLPRGAGVRRAGPASGCPPRPSGRRPPGTTRRPAARAASRGATRIPVRSTPTSASGTCRRPRSARTRRARRRAGCTS